MEAQAKLSGRYMKKFFISTVVIIILAAVVFFLGWIQIQVDDGEYLVIFTKLHGWESEIVRPGEFVWKWQAIFPTVLKRYHFTDQVINIESRVRATLPEAELYSQFLPEAPQFNYSAQINLSYRIRPDQVPSLLGDAVFRPENYDDFIHTTKNQLSASLNDFIPAVIAEIGGELSRSPVIEAIPDISARLTELIEEQYAYVEVTSLNPVALQFPDMELYRIARQRYFSVLEAGNEALGRAQGELSRIELITSAQRESLSVLGELLDSHPSLLEYLTLVTESGRDPLEMAERFQEALNNPDAREILSPEN